MIKTKERLDNILDVDDFTKLGANERIKLKRIFTKTSEFLRSR
jgi:hypothetical protein